MTSPLTAVSLSPNPATFKVNITAASSIKAIKIFTLSGEEVMSRAGSNTNSITLVIGLLPKGLYNVRVITDHQPGEGLLYKAG